MHDSKTVQKRTASRGRDRTTSSGGGRPCDREGCQREGLYRAPRDPDELTSYYWFCLEHVRLYNASWDYGGGWTPEQIERKIRHDALWERQTRPLTGREALPLEERLRQRAENVRSGGDKPQRRKHPPHLPKEVREALDFFDLSYPPERAHLRQSYLRMVKAYHPDAQSGDSQMEERLKTVTRHYALLKNHSKIG